MQMKISQQNHDRGSGAYLCCKHTMQANKFPLNAEYCMIVRKLIYSVPESIPVNAQCCKQCNENRLTMCDLWP